MIMDVSKALSMPSNAMKFLGSKEAKRLLGAMAIVFPETNPMLRFLVNSLIKASTFKESTKTFHNRKMAFSWLQSHGEN